MMNKIDITPSWRFIVKGFLQVFKSHSKKSLSNDDYLLMRKELLKLADIGDDVTQEHHGYTNKVTHTIMSQIDNDEMMRNCFMNDAVDMGLNNITLGQYIKEHFYGLKPELDQFNESMLSWSYAMVNWEEIAEHILDAVAEECE